MKYLLDTNVVSELVARRPDPRVIQWIDSLDPNSVYLSAITIGELRKGVEKLPPSPRQEALHVWLAQLRSMDDARRSGVDPGSLPDPEA